MSGESKISRELPNDKYLAAVNSTADASNPFASMSDVGGSSVTSVTATAPITSTGGATPDIGITSATPIAAGSMSSSDYTKLSGIATGAQPGTVTSVAATAPLTVVASPTAPSVQISKADTTTDGYLDSTDWNTFNSKGDGVVTTLTTTGSGAATLVGDTLNIPTPTGTGDMLASTYDPTGVAADVYDYSNQIGLTQMPSAQITTYTESGGGSVEIDNYDLSTYNVHYIDPGAHDRDFTGMVAPSAGVQRIVVIINVGTNKKLKFKDNDGDSDAANRMLLADTADFDLEEGASVQFIYNHTTNRWHTYSYY